MSEETKEIAVAKPLPEQLVVHDDGEFSLLLDSAKFHQAWRVAKLFAASKLVPVHFQGSPESVFVALHMALRLQLDPMMLMQNTYMVSGRPGMEAKLIMALVNARGPFSGPIQWRMEGEGVTRRCTAYATHAKTNEICEATVTWEMVEAEGWSKKAGSKWLTLPDLMFRYRSAAFLARLYCPEVIMGLNTVDELEDMDWQIKPAMATEESAHLPQDLPQKKSIIAVPPPDVATVKTFDQETADLDPQKLAGFLMNSARHFKISVDQVKDRAMTDIGKFRGGFEKWCAKAFPAAAAPEPDKKPGRGRPPKPPVETVPEPAEPAIPEVVIPPNADMTAKMDAKTLDNFTSLMIRFCETVDIEKDGPTWTMESLNAEIGVWFNVQDVSQLNLGQVQDAVTWMKQKIEEARN
jgi:hypothetical protein